MAYTESFLPSSFASDFADFSLLLHFFSSACSSYSSSSSSKLVTAALLAFGVLLIWVFVALVSWLHAGGPAWGAASLRSISLLPAIPGPRGLPLVGSLLAFAGQKGHLAHRRLAELASLHKARPLMALSLGSTRVVVASLPSAARQILCNFAFAERPISLSAKQLLFERAIGFAPRGDHSRKLRQVAASQLFSARRVAAQEHVRQEDAREMVGQISERVKCGEGLVRVREYLQHAALNNIMATVFGRRYASFGCGNGLLGGSDEAEQVQSMVREGFELLGAFNLADHLPACFESVDPLRVRQRCNELVPRVYAFVQGIIDEHRQKKTDGSDSVRGTDFVDVLLGLQGQQKLADADMVAVLWEMIFRGTDTMAILTEWILAELVLNPRVQSKLYAEVQQAAANSESSLRDADIARMPYLQALIKEGLRMHPPGPLLSWARLAVHDVEVAGHFIPAGTTAMVNMWAITHDEEIWEEPGVFRPERFLHGEGGQEVDVKGGDMRLAPFGAGARACPGRALAMATVSLWVARLVQSFEMREDASQAVELDELLKLSCEMAVPLCARFTPRN
ncbi:hypothetical protein L7F22_038445 [Adiantum nelumboides]|nr:hypothetical protein [Adiantum nelumboides]